MKINIIIILNAIILTSCTDVYFDKPQPINCKKILIVPEEFRGTWTEIEDFDTVVIGSNYLFAIQYNERPIAKTEIDSSSSYKLTKNKLYIFENNNIESGNYYYTKNDTIYAQEVQFLEFHIGYNVIVKMVDDYLIVNIRDEDTFWRIYYFQKCEDNSIIIRGLKNNNMKILLDQGKLDFIDWSFGGNYFYEASLSEEDIIQLIENNCFSDTIAILPLKYKIE